MNISLVDKVKERARRRQRQREEAAEKQAEEEVEDGDEEGEEEEDDDDEDGQTEEDDNDVKGYRQGELMSKSSFLFQTPRYSFSILFLIFYKLTPIVQPTTKPSRALALWHSSRQKTRPSSQTNQSRPSRTFQPFWRQSPPSQFQSKRVFQAKTPKSWRRVKFELF